MTDVPILLYHEVAAATTAEFAPYAVTPDAFERHAELIAERATATLTVSELADAMVAGDVVEPGTVVVTVDDGFADFADHGWPTLARHGIAATLYVSSAYVGGSARWLESLGEGDRAVAGWEQLVRLADEGLEIGAHSHTHPHLDLLDDAAIRHEVATSHQIIQHRLGREIRTFAYPHGFHDRRVRQAVIDAGFDSACAVKNALSSTDDDRFALARVTVDATTSLDQLDRWLQGLDLAPPPPRERLRTSAHRIARRARQRMGTAS